MEKEYFLSGYCRVLDESRIVAVVLENGQLTDVDCCFCNCVHTPNCTIAKQIHTLTEEANKE